jgi:hypothetical protein
MNRKYYENLSVSEIERLYEEFQNSLGKNCFMDCDNYKIYRWSDDDVNDVFMDRIYVRKATAYEKMIFDLYWNRLNR